MITPSFSITATERVLPKMALDFTTGALDSRVTFTRSGAIATRVNASGFVETVSANTARFDYNAVTLACNGLLIEEARTNLLFYSEELDVIANWTPVGSTVSANVIAAPTNAQTADKITETATTANHLITQVSALTSGTTYTYSVFLKKAERGFALIAFTTAFPTTSVQINLTTGAITTGTGTPLNAFSKDYGNGWFRVGFTLTATSTATASINVYISTDGLWANRTYAGNGTSGIYVWGSQLEAAAFATSYIPTTASQITRTADVAVMTGTNFSDWYSANVGGLVVRVLPSTVISTRPAIQFDDTTANEIIALRGNTTNPELYIVDGGTPQAQIDAGTISANTVYNLGAAFAANNCAASVDGNAVVTDTSATMPTVTQARLGSDGTNYLNGHLQTVRSWPQRIIDAEIQSFSK